MEAELFGDVNGAAAGQQGAAEREPGTSGIFRNWKKQFSTAGIRIRKSLQLQGLACKEEKIKRRKMNKL